MICDCCGDEIPETTDAWNITVQGENVLLHGHLVGDVEVAREFAMAMKPFGLVIASPMEPPS